MIEGRFTLETGTKDELNSYLHAAEQVASANCGGHVTAEEGKCKAELVVELPGNKEIDYWATTVRSWPNAKLIKHEM